MKVKRFLVFEFTPGKQRGGWDDFKASYDTVEEVMANHSGRCQLIDIETGLMGLPHGYESTSWK